MMMTIRATGVGPVAQVVVVAYQVDTSFRMAGRAILQQTYLHEIYQDELLQEILVFMARKGSLTRPLGIWLVGTNMDPLSTFSSGTETTSDACDAIDRGGKREERRLLEALRLRIAFICGRFRRIQHHSMSSPIPKVPPPPLEGLIALGRRQALIKKICD